MDEKNCFLRVFTCILDILFSPIFKAQNQGAANTWEHSRGWSPLLSLSDRAWAGHWPSSFFQARFQRSRGGGHSRPTNCTKRTWTAAALGLRGGRALPAGRSAQYGSVVLALMLLASSQRQPSPSSVPGPVLGVRDTRVHAHYTLPRSCLSQSPCPHRLIRHRHNKEATVFQITGDKCKEENEADGPSH